MRLIIALLALVSIGEAQSSVLHEETHCGSDGCVTTMLPSMDEYGIEENLAWVRCYTKKTDWTCNHHRYPSWGHCRDNKPKAYDCIPVNLKD